MSHPILQLSSLSKTFPGQIALNQVDLEVRSGSIHALLGHNGSGKSTLIKLLSGFEKPDWGYQAWLNNELTDLWEDRLRNRHQIRIVHQDLGLVPTLNAIENLALGRGYHTGLLGSIHWEHEALRAQELLRGLGILPDVRKPVGLLSRAEQTYVAIGRALQNWDDYTKGLLILDEPTAALQSTEVDFLFKTMRKIRDQGAGILYVSHRLNEVLSIADYVSVLQDGVRIHSGPVGELDKARLVEILTQGQNKVRHISRREPGKKVVLECNSVFSSRLRGVDFKLYQREILGVAGLIGSGRDEIGAVLFGAKPRFSGRILVEKQKVYAHPREAIQAGIGYVPSDRTGLGLVERHRLFEHLTLPDISRNTNRFGHINRNQELKDVESWSKIVDLRPLDLFRRMHKFSGGNQQKAVIARWMRLQPKVLILDEPTQGVDIQSREVIYCLIAEACQQGASIIVCSSEAEELALLCHRVIVLKAGLKVADLSVEQLTSERIELEATGTSNRRRGMRVHQHQITTTVLR